MWGFYGVINPKPSPLILSQSKCGYGTDIFPYLPQHVDVEFQYTIWDDIEYTNFYSSTTKNKY